MMKVLSIILMVMFFFGPRCSAQELDTFPGKRKWDFTIAGNLYLIPKEVYINPVFAADYKHLHLEARYNYEDINTASTYLGYTFSVEGEFQVNLTPLGGVVFGNTNGLAPGLLLDLTYRRFNLSSESLYLFVYNTSTSNYLYSWTDLVYSPFEWMSVGVSIQRLTLVDTGLDVQRGLTLGFTQKGFSVVGYAFNLSTDESYGVLSLEYAF